MWFLKASLMSFIMVYSGCPTTERSVWRNERKSIRLSNVRISNVQFINLERNVRFGFFSAELDRFI